MFEKSYKIIENEKYLAPFMSELQHTFKNKILINVIYKENDIIIGYSYIQITNTSNFHYTFSCSNKPFIEKKEYDDVFKVLCKKIFWGICFLIIPWSSFLLPFFAANLVKNKKDSSFFKSFLNIIKTPEYFVFNYHHCNFYLPYENLEKLKEGLNNKIKESIFETIEEKTSLYNKQDLLNRLLKYLKDEKFNNNSNNKNNLFLEDIKVDLKLL